jgi:rhamnosyltransferase subunit B
VHRIFNEWINSPRLVIGLFPDWFAARQPDWPTQFLHASFPLWDDPEGVPLDAELASFLDTGTPPVVVFPGSANRHGAPLFRAAMIALERLGRRGLFLTGFPEQIPTDLPATILHRAYAPFSVVLSRSAALIHHGGIGTLAQGLAAGIPQLIMPMAFDQPDNALRASRLGVARWLAPKHFTPERVEHSLRELVHDSAVARAAAEHRARLRDANGIRQASDLLERAANAATRSASLRRPSLELLA